jgi:poly(A) polymerase Pap1
MMRENDETQTDRSIERSKDSVQNSTELPAFFTVEDVTWDDLFTLDSFFTNHQVYLEITALTKSPDHKNKHSEFTGLLESRLKSLQLTLEQETGSDDI